MEGGDAQDGGSEVGGGWTGVGTRELVLDFSRARIGEKKKTQAPTLSKCFIFKKLFL